MLEPYKKLTYDEVIEILSNLAVRLIRLEDVITNFWDIYKKQDEFLTYELLKDELDLGLYKKKIQPFNRVMSKRITEVDNSLKGFIKYYHEDIEKKLSEQKPKRFSKYD